MNISNHKFDGVDFVPTKKQGGVFTPRGIVLHFTAGWTTAGDIHTLAKSDRKASAHVVLSREGDWTQIVPFNRIAWHAGPSKWGKFVGLNNSFIGIEVSNIGYLKKLSNGEYIDEYGNRLDGDGNFLNTNREAYSAPKDWHVHYNKVLAPGPTYVWEPFYTAQLNALEAGCRALIKKYPTIEHIVTHEEIDTRGWKTDINGGRAFPMRRFLGLLTNDEYTDRQTVTKTDAVVVSSAPAVAQAPPAAPTLQTPIIAALPPDAAVQILHSDETWAFIELPDGLKGWFPRIGLRVG